MAIWALAGTLAFSFLLELGAFLIHAIEPAHKKTPDEDDKPEE